MVSSSTLMASLKALLVSASAVSIAVVALGATVLSISGPLGPQLPPALGWFLSWFKPPYPFIVVNVIIAAIAATSMCFRHAQRERIAVAVMVKEEMEIMEATPAAAEEAFDESTDFEEKRVVVVAAAGNGGGSGCTDGYNGDCEGERKVAFGRSVSVRDDTDRQISLSEPELEPPPQRPPLIQKSATFKDRAAQQPPLSPIKLSRVRSQDDLDRRVEEFINKFKEKMRLEYEEMISQGT